MVEQTIDLIRRVQAILGVRSAFFDAVCEWYSNVTLARKAVKLLAPRPPGDARVSLAVNGVAGGALDVTAQSRNLAWMLPPGLVTVGDNDIAVCVEKAAGVPFSVQAASASQEGVLPPQTVDLSRADPTRAACMQLVAFGAARHHDDAWELKTGGYLTFRLQLHAPVAVTFSLTLPGGDDDGWFDDLEDLLKDIKDRIEEKRNQLEEERRRAAQRDPGRAARLDSQVADLVAYAQLQQAQIEPAFRGGDGVTLQEVIRRTGDPDQLIARYQASWTVRPVLMEEPAPFAPPPPVAAPALPTPRPIPARSAPRPARKGGCSGCLTVLFVGALVVGGLGFYCWKYVLPGPAVHFDSLEEGQTVAAGAPLQVWASGEDLLGVKSLSVAVESGGENLVDGSASPAPFPFKEYTPDTGTKVFTLNLKPYAGPPKSINLVASLTTARGTVTARRIVQVGGTEQSLVYEINPPQPQPGQGVDVILHAVNVPPGASVTYTLEGTDNWRQGVGDPLTVGPDGTARYHVPGAGWGVTDKLDARIEGTGVHKKASYTFGD